MHAKWQVHNPRVNAMKRRHLLPVLVAASFVLVFLNSRSTQAHSAQTSTLRPIPVEYLQVPDLPVSISLTTLEKTEKGYVLKCAADNSSGDQILGVTFLLLVVDYESKVRAQSAGLPECISRVIRVRSFP